MVGLGVTHGRQSRAVVEQRRRRRRSQRAGRRRQSGRQPTLLKRFGFLERGVTENETCRHPKRGARLQWSSEGNGRNARERDDTHANVWRVCKGTVQLISAFASNSRGNPEHAVVEKRCDAVRASLRSPKRAKTPKSIFFLFAIFAFADWLTEKDAFRISRAFWARLGARLG